MQMIAQYQDGAHQIIDVSCLCSGLCQIWVVDLMVSYEAYAL